MWARFSKPTLETLQEQADTIEQLQDQLLRLRADYDNAQKRWTNTQSDLKTQIRAEALSGFLEILDDFDRALQTTEDEDSSDSFRKGIELIAGRIHEFIKEQGIDVMNAKGELFDPSRHEAVAHEETADYPDSTVVEELRKGYLLGDRTLRPAVVKIAKQPELTEQSERKIDG